MNGPNDNGFRMTCDGYMGINFRYKGRQLCGPTLNSVEYLAKLCRPFEPLQSLQFRSLATVTIHPKRE